MITQIDAPARNSLDSIADLPLDERYAALSAWYLATLDAFDRVAAAYAQTLANRSWLEEAIRDLILQRDINAKEVDHLRALLAPYEIRTALGESAPSSTAGTIRDSINEA